MEPGPEQDGAGGAGQRLLGLEWEGRSREPGHELGRSLQVGRSPGHILSRPSLRGKQALVKQHH